MMEQTYRGSDTGLPRTPYGDARNDGEGTIRDALGDGGEAEHSHTKLALISGASTIGARLFSMLFKFVTRGIFLYYLSLELIGVNTLLLSIIGAFTIFDTGLNNALSFAFFKPLAKGDVVGIRSVFELYKKLFLVFGFIVAVIGLALIPVLPQILGDAIDTPFIYPIYFMFLVAAVGSYVLRGKRPILMADQRQYIIAITQFIFDNGAGILQVLALIFLPFDIATKFFLFVAIYAASVIGQTIRMMFQSNKLYKYVDVAQKAPLEKAVIASIKKQSAGSLIWTFSHLLNKGLDNVLLAIYTSVSVVGFYANYDLIVMSIRTLFINATSAIIPGIGQLIHKRPKEHMLKIFQRLFFITFSAATVVGNVVFTCINPLIYVWIGKQYFLSEPVSALIVGSLVLQILLMATGTFVNAYAMLWELRKVSILSAVINFGTAMFCFNILHLGVAAVVISSILSFFIVDMWITSYLIYKLKLEAPFSDYVNRCTKYLATILIVGVVNYFLTNFIPYGAGHGYITLFGRGGIAFLVSTLAVVGLYGRTPEFKYVLSLITKIFQKITKPFHTR